MIIYKVTNKITGKIYIGQTIQPLEKRIKGHIKESNLDNNRPFLSSLKKYGIDNFNFETIDTAKSQIELDEREIYWINELNTISPNGYNILGGGQGKKMVTNSEFGKIISIGLKKSEKWNRVKNSDEYKEKMKKSFFGYFKGKKFSDEHKKKIWEKNKERIIEFNKSTSKKWIVIDSQNNIERIISKDDYFKDLGLDTGCLSRMSKRLESGKKTKRYDGYYCIIDNGQPDEEILKMVNSLDDFFNLNYKIINRLTNEVKNLKKSEVYHFCIKNNYDYSSFLRMIKGKFKSYKNWVVFTDN